MSEKYAFNPEDIDKLEMDKYSDKYSEDDLWKKVSKTAAKVGAKVIYQALLLFYVAQSPVCPMKIKAGIIAALGYFISPIDLIPDLIPVAGYTDDAAGIATALMVAHMYITDDIRAQAKEKIVDIFGEEILEHIED